MIVPTVGRIVLYSLPVKDHAGTIILETRAAIVARVWDRTDGKMPMVNLLLVRDGGNDGSEGFLLPVIPDAIDPALRAYLDQLQRKVYDLERLVVWKTSVSYDQDGAANSWRWMPYQLGQAAKAAAPAGGVGASESLAEEVARLRSLLEKHLAAQELGNTETEEPHVPAAPAEPAAAAPEA
jgi:hypothetical protein